MLNFNPKKCKCIVFGDSSFDEFEFKLSNQSLEIVEEIKILGFVLNHPISMKMSLFLKNSIQLGRPSTHYILLV